MNREKGGRAAVKTGCVLALALVCLLCAVFGRGRVEQSLLAVPGPLSFSGEYRFEGEDWQPLTDASRLSARRGDLYLRGHFSSEIPEGMLLNFYQDHIGCAITLNGELWLLDGVLELSELGIKLEPAACSRRWGGVLSPGITAGDEVEIHLYNPHRYGNAEAYRHFLSTLCISQNDGQALLRANLEPFGKPFRTVGGLLMLAALMLLGGAAAAAAMGLKGARTLLRTGLMTLFAGGYFVLDTIDVSFWSERAALNTYGLWLCAMLLLYFAGEYVGDSLTGRRKKAALAATWLSALVNCAVFLLSAARVMLIYDSAFIWAISQTVICPVLIVCCGAQLRAAPGKGWSVPVSGLLLFSAALLDLLGVGGSILSSAPLTKGAFLIVFAVHAFEQTKKLVISHQATKRADRLEKELEASRIAIMLSQIQPHFLYNSLGVIQELCHSEPEEAEKAIGKFAEFLKGNMTALTADKLIPFEEELNHTGHYLEIEQLRFGDQLRVEYEIETTAFSLPTLTIQPLVENAVRHGVRKNEEGGCVTISAHDRGRYFEVTIRDDGPGFDPDAVGEDGKTHVGLNNVRERLMRMCGGTLQIRSERGKGTGVSVIIPKEDELC